MHLWRTHSSMPAHEVDIRNFVKLLYEKHTQALNRLEYF